MEPEAFAHAFKGEIRVLLTWTRVHLPEISVEERTIEDRGALAMLRTVWYVTPDGRLGDWRAPENRALRVGEAGASHDVLPPESRTHIAAFQEAFRQSPGPVELDLPAYGLPGGEALVLDGTHRLVAACVAEVGVRIRLATLRGPIDPRILPDLAHYVYGSPAR